MDPLSFSRAGRVARVLVVSAAAVWAFEAGACGGITDIDPRGGALDAGVSTGGYGNTPVGAGATGPYGYCGNGLIEKGEQCDSNSFPGTATCSLLTMAARPYGQPECINCRIDDSSCYSADTGGAPGAGGYYGYGGYYNTGGAIAYGGYAGYAGGIISPPPPIYTSAQCYQNGGVFDPRSGQCYTGQQATNTCFNLSFQGDAGAYYAYCGAGCGCNYCPSSYAQCQNTPNCSAFLTCANQVCKSAADCYKLGCAGYIDAVGGLGSPGAAVMDSALSCLYSAGCSPACATAIPITQ